MQRDSQLFCQLPGEFLKEEKLNQCLPILEIDYNNKKLS